MHSVPRLSETATQCKLITTSLPVCFLILFFLQTGCWAQIEVFNNRDDFELAATNVSALKSIEDFDSASNLEDEFAVVIESSILLPGVPFVDELGRGFPKGLQASEDIGMISYPDGEFGIFNTGFKGLASIAVGPSNAFYEPIIEVITENDINIGIEMLSPISNSTSFTIIVLDPNGELLFFDPEFTTGTNGLDGFIGFVTNEETAIWQIWLENNSGFPEMFVDDIQIWQRVLKGDVNLDGVVDLLDVDPFIQQLSSGVYLPEADANCDGVFDLLDVAAFISILNGN